MSKRIPTIKSKREYRCSHCGKLLALGNGAEYGIKCLRCGRVNTLFSELKDQVIITETSGVILFVNDEVERMTGYSPAELLGKTPSVWGGQMSKEFYVEFWRLLLEEKKAIIAKVNNKNKSGGMYKALVRVTPVFGPGGEIHFFVGIESALNKDEEVIDSAWSMPKLA